MIKYIPAPQHHTDSWCTNCVTLHCGCDVICSRVYSHICIVSASLLTVWAHSTSKSCLSASTHPYMSLSPYSPVRFSKPFILLFGNLTAYSLRSKCTQSQITRLQTARLESLCDFTGSTIGTFVLLLKSSCIRILTLMAHSRTCATYQKKFVKASIPRTSTL